MYLSSNFRSDAKRYDGEGRRVKATPRLLVIKIIYLLALRWLAIAITIPISIASRFAVL